MAGLLGQMRAAERARNQGLLSHTPQQRVSGRQVADALQTMGLLASPIPVVGDVAGLLGDAAMYAAKPEERTLGNAAMTMLGMLPFFPSALGHVNLPKMTRVFHGSPHGPIVGTPRLATADDLLLNASFSTTTKKSIADAYSKGLLGYQGPGPSPAITEFLLHGDAPKYSKVLDAALADAKKSGAEIGLGTVDKFAAKKGIKAVKYLDDGLHEIAVLDPSALVQMPNKSPIKR
jgi:hypothetical protein